MLHHSRKAADIAAQLRNELGQDAFSFVSARVEEARQTCDERGLRLWNDVAGELVKPDQCANENGRAVSSPLWGLMQRIEYYRHRAAEVERKAAAAPEAYRKDLLDLATQWRDLALHVDLQARLSGANGGADPDAGS
ncbi:MAG TPA: hypothetical protein VK801_09350 [Caulobacteraceae bacterium]|nr:hypothetical protein [Caulobacteraceae bacterium]